MSKAAIATLGCKVNHYESAGIMEALARRGLTIVPFNSPADIFIVDTCTVTEKSDFQSRQLIRRAYRKNPSALIIVTGCYAQIAPAILAEEPGVSLVVGTGAKDMIPDLVSDECIDGQRLIVPDVASLTQCSCPPVTCFEGQTRAYLKVQDGCDAFCSYCIVPHARGPSRSVPVDDVLARLRELVEAGFREVVLTGIHLGAYGHDLMPETGLCGLLKRIENETKLERLRLSSIEPADLTDDIITFMRDSAILCRHLHIPLQSGDDEILRAMNRHYTSGEFRERIEAVLQSVPEAGVGIDVMAGFPGESAREFEASLTFLESLPVAYFHVFPYSKRPGTAAVALPGHVAETVKKERAVLLRGLGNAKRHAFNNRAVGSMQSVLVEDTWDSSTGYMRGFSENYIPILIEDAPHNSARSVIRVRVTESRDGRTIGRRIHD